MSSQPPQALPPSEFLLAGDGDIHALLQTNLDGYLLVDKDGRLVGANEAYLRMSGYTLQELLQLCIHDLDALETPVETDQRTERILKEGSDRFESRHRRKDGTSFPVEVSTRFLPSRALMVGYIRDLTEREAAETALRERAAFYRELMEMLGEGVSMVDATETFILANPAAERMFGVAPGGLLGKNLRFFLDEAERERVQQFTRRRVLGQAETYELRIRRADGALRTLQTTVTPRFDATGLLIGELGVSRDITEDLQAKETLRLAQKMESLGNLAGGLAHDMNNVLGAILGLASTHLDQEPEGSRLRATFETIQKASLRGRNMVKSLLDFARKDVAGERAVAVNALLRDQAEFLDPTLPGPVNLALDLDPKAGSVLGDADALALMVMNLCSNAVDAMPYGGTLVLSSRALEDGRVLLAVADTGVGMTPETLEHATDPFFTTKPHGKGTGLGLSLAYSTVKAHRGELSLQSRPGQGTRIEIRLPMLTSLPERTPEVAPATLLGSTGRCILLVDDDELIQSAVSAQLEAMGHAAEVACSGEVAMERLAQGYRPEAIILDMNMPGWGGARTLPRLRAALPEVPILLSTGRTDQRALDLARTFPGVAILPKPFGYRDLQAALAAILPSR